MKSPQEKAPYTEPTSSNLSSNLRTLLIKRTHPDAKLPYRGTENSVGLDLHAYLVSETGRPSTAIIPPRNTRAIPTGLVVSPPEGFALYLCSRSGLAKERSLFVTNAPGVIDPDYRGELMVLLYNGGTETYYVKHEDRIGQLIALPALIMSMMEIDDLPLNTSRGDKGFGSTGR